MSFKPEGDRLPDRHRCYDRLPFQTLDDLAGDLLFMKEFDIDMCGMGPYIEHADTRWQLQVNR